MDGAHRARGAAPTVSGKIRRVRGLQPRAGSGDAARRTARAAHVEIKMESTVTNGLSRSKSARAGVERYQELGPPARERRNAAGVSRALRLGEMHALVHPLSPGRAQKTQPAYRGWKRERAAR